MFAANEQDEPVGAEARGEGDFRPIRLRDSGNGDRRGSGHQVAADRRSGGCVPPAAGGDADMCAAHEALEDASGGRLEGLVAVHSAVFSQIMAMGAAGPLHPDEQQNPPVRQPLVRVHEPTGRRSLFVGRHAQFIERLDEAEGRNYWPAAKRGT